MKYYKKTNQPIYTLCFTEVSEIISPTLVIIQVTAVSSIFIYFLFISKIIINTSMMQDIDFFLFYLTCQTHDPPSSWYLKKYQISSKICLLIKIGNRIVFTDRSARVSR